MLNFFSKDNILPVFLFLKSSDNLILISLQRHFVIFITQTILLACTKSMFWYNQFKIKISLGLSVSYGH